jgi:hypothetical protein
MFFCDGCLESHATKPGRREHVVLPYPRVEIQACTTEGHPSTDGQTALVHHRRSLSATSTGQGTSIDPPAALQVLPDPTLPDEVATDVDIAAAVDEENDRRIQMAYTDLAQPVAPPTTLVPPQPWRFGTALTITYVTWNMAQSAPPSDDSLRSIVRPTAHVIAFGTQENGPYVGSNTAHLAWQERIMRDLNADAGGGKPTWGYRLVDALSMYATHLVVVVRDDVAKYVDDVHSASEKTGLAGVMGNKGGIGVALSFISTGGMHLAASQKPKEKKDKKKKGHTRQGSVSESMPNSVPPGSPTPGSPTNRRSSNTAPEGETEQIEVHGRDLDEELDDGSPTIRFSMLFICAHLAPHQDNVTKRNQDYHDIIGNLKVGSKGPFPDRARRCMSGAVTRDCTEEFDVCVFGGDLNYRINGSKKATEKLALSSHRAVLINNDQLTIELKRGNVFHQFREQQVKFPPTYKFSKDKKTGLYTDEYDNSAKQRMAAYCDRVLYKAHLENRLPIEPVHYRSVDEIKTSDHHPVVGIFSVATPSLLSLSAKAAAIVNRDDGEDEDEDENAQKGCCCCCVVS